MALGKQTLPGLLKVADSKVLSEMGKPLRLGGYAAKQVSQCAGPLACSSRSLQISKLLPGQSCAVVPAFSCSPPLTV